MGFAGEPVPPITFSELIVSMNSYLPSWAQAWARGSSREGPSGELSPQLTAFFTSAPILASSAAVNSFSA